VKEDKISFFDSKYFDTNFQFHLSSLKQEEGCFGGIERAEERPLKATLPLCEGE